ncbi:MAG: hypothetical protein CR986_06090 [Ignavibacteriae bacterium]|nr:MAG: hypothetical protein CR986_06090 [Ignavibacteriota bacterium]
MKKLAFILALTITTFAQDNFIKREFRGAWVASVINLDWPSSKYLSTEEQKKELIQLFNKLEATNINAVIFQIRTECDAFYNSPYEPWSYWLTGSQGTAPSPYYDPLEFAIEEAHKRGMELHAWFNPYRVERQIGNYTTASNHVTKVHPEWTLSFGSGTNKIKILNPGLKEVRKYVTNVVMDVVNRYDVNGIHFDDYFYPYPPNKISGEDYQTFNADPRGFLDINDWRRDNVNELLRMIYDSIQVAKPEVKFGMSPFGIYKNGVPKGTYGLDAYSTIYCDPVAWLNEKIIDYITPQLYWAFGGGQDYGKLLPWWASQTNGRHLYPGQAIYRVGKPFNKTEIPRQIRLDRATDNCQGSIFFRAKFLEYNPLGLTDSLENNYYKNKALIPQMNWKDSIVPNVPTNLRYEKLAGQRGNGLVWDRPNLAADNDSASMYVVYELQNNTPQQSDFDNPANISKITSGNSTPISSRSNNSNLFFSVTALDGNNNESINSEVLELQLTVPHIPDLEYPLANANKQRDTTQLVWFDSEGANTNRLQVATDSSFSDIILNKVNLVDTSYLVTNIDGLTNYYWRVSASNIAGESEFSEVRRFTTGFPISPLLVSPANKTLDVALDTFFVWNYSDSSVSYQFQLAEGLSIGETNVVIDTVLSDTLLLLKNLKPKQLYAWHVRGINEFGNSKWSKSFQFKTIKPTGLNDDFSIPNDFYLSQNYPNPFNPETTIEFSISKSGLTILKIYDILGKEVLTLKNEFMNSGKYSVKFDGSKLSSGVYIYVLKNNHNFARKKMLLLK